MENAKLISIHLPTDLDTEIKKATKDDGKTVKTILHRALRQYLTNHTSNTTLGLSNKRAKRKKQKPPLGSLTLLLTDLSD